MRKTKINAFMCTVFIYVIFIVSMAGGCARPDEIDKIENTANLTGTPGISETAVETTEPGFDAEAGFGIMEIFIFDTGKADAFLITTKNHAVMIDAGETRHGLEIARYLIDCGITAIDYLIITHFHKDHVGGAAEIITNLEVKEVITPDYGKDSKQYNDFIEAMNKAEIERGILKETMELNIDGVKFILYPSEQEYFDCGGAGEDEDETGEDDDNNISENNFSIVASVNHGNHNFLFTGDAKAKRLGELLSIDGIINTKYDFLKIPHHGNYNRRSIEFICAINPKYAVITCSGDKPADGRIISALEETGAEIYLTSDGDIYCKSDGDILIVERMRK